ncbi:ribonucleoside-diphosphate reductase, partial [Francisella tularensis subsp. holarctica]|nr:ribonucleoside-diphosphate reductase [Francisella tularensis subsp. holarctica]
TNTTCPVCDRATSWVGAHEIPFPQLSLDVDINRADFDAEVKKNILVVEELILSISKIFVVVIVFGVYVILLDSAG